MATWALPWLLCATLLLPYVTASRGRYHGSSRDGCGGDGSGSKRVDSADSETLRDLAGKVTALWTSLLHPDPGLSSDSLRASCAMEPSQAGAPHVPVRGLVLFQQKSALESLEMLLRLEGFPTERRSHGIHVHARGEIVPGCDAAGPHFNPRATPHGSHPGDFGNFKPDAEGRVRERVGQLHATLYGHESIIGRSIVVHEHEDDLGQGDNEGSRLHGNAGARIACCVIGVGSGATWEQHAHA